MPRREIRENHRSSQDGQQPTIDAGRDEAARYRYVGDARFMERLSDQIKQADKQERLTLRNAHQSERTRIIEKRTRGSDNVLTLPEVLGGCKPEKHLINSASLAFSTHFSGRGRCVVDI